MNMKAENWIGQSDGWARPMDWNNPADKAEMLAAMAREAEDEYFRHAEQVAELGADAARRRRDEWQELHATDFANYSREHRAPEGAEEELAAMEQKRRTVPLGWESVG